MQNPGDQAREKIDMLLQLFGDGKALGTIEAKPEAHTLIGVEEQPSNYRRGIREQEAIVAEFNRRLSVVEELASLSSINLNRAVRLRQSILQVHCQLITNHEYQDDTRATDRRKDR
jgi:hypothetical protein